MSGAEELVAQQWIKETLLADGALTTAAPGGAWDGPANEASVMPIIRVDSQGPGVVLRTGAGTAEVWVNGLWIIAGVCEGTSYTPIKTVAERIHADLHGVTGLTVTGGIIHACVREESFHMEAVIGGRQFRHLGGIYRIYVS